MTGLGKVPVDETCLLCGLTLVDDPAPSFIYNAPFDTTTEVHTVCLGYLIAARRAVEPKRKGLYVVPDPRTASP